MSNYAVIFTGPSLPPVNVSDINLEARLCVFESLECFLNAAADDKSDINILPPVSEGDVFKLIKGQPKIIGVIDGFFENIPSIWHKEILYAMSTGIHVYGAASMGALRAAELDTYGMKGVGKIFESYRDGLLEDDDEVTVVHSPPELGYISLSEAMVNIRRTMNDACNEGCIDEYHHNLFIKALKETFYKKRNYSLLKKQKQVDPKVQDSFFNWLKSNRKDQKQEDAVALLKKIDQDLKNNLPGKEVNYMFEDTVIWRNIVGG